MASRTPTLDLPTASARARRQSYLQSWAEISRLIDAGVSWSGQERHCIYLNAGEDGFFDVSGASGLDLIEDGRSVLLWDWNGDGAQDLVFRHRSGAQIRAFVNRQPARAVVVRLRGERDNLDGIGTWATLELADGRRIARWRDGGESYLAQSSRDLHFGLGGTAMPRRLHLEWPSGESQTLEIPGPGRFLARQGATEVLSLPAPAAADLAAGPLDPGREPEDADLVLLRIPLRLPPSLRELCRLPGEEGERKRPKIVTLWSATCAPCLEELREWSEQSALLRAGGTSVLALGLDDAAERERALELFRKATAVRPGAIFERAAGPRGAGALAALVDHVRGLEQDLPLPTTLVLDAADRVQLVVFGRISPERLSELVRRWAGDRGPPGAFRSLRGGRWYFRARRNLPELARRLEELGLEADARELMAEHRRTGRR